MIVDGVIRLITPGMVIRRYLETHKELTLDWSKKNLCSHYDAKNTSELYQVLASLCQKPKESPQAFLMNALYLRQPILFACGEEDHDNACVFGQCLDLPTVFIQL